MRRTLPCLVWAACAVAAAAQTRFDLHQVEWTMRPDPSGERIAMEMRLDPIADRDRVVLRIPLWRPGSYRYASYQDNISSLTVEDQTGLQREIRALDPRTWEVDTRAASSLVVRYDLAVTNEADPGATPAIHLHSPAVFLYLEDALGLPHTLRFELPDGWEVASGHRPDPREPGRFRSPDYDVLVDCPIALGGLERRSFELRGKPFEVVFFGLVPDEADFSRDDWTATVRRICDASYQIVGDFPFEKYVFLFLFNRQPGGYGLEHLNSTTIAFNHRPVANGDLSMLESVTAHEFFHLWNVKRIRPEQLGPFDYSADVRTNDLWWLEGVTDYYAAVILQRAGMRDPHWLFDSVASTFRSMASSPGYGLTSPERSSWTVWDPDRSARISYYDQGKVLGLLLDLKIRLETDNRRSLDDVVRFLNRWIDYPEPGYRPGDLERAIYAVTGWDCSAFFDRHVSGLVEPPFRSILPAAGLEVVWAEPGSAFLGFGLESGLIVSVRAGTSAHQAGLRPGDRLLQVGSEPIGGAADLGRVLGMLPPGGMVPVKVLRGGAALDLELPVLERTRRIFRLQPDPDASDAQKALYEGILRGQPAPV